MANYCNGLGFNNYAARYMADVVTAGGTTPGLLVQQAIETLSVEMWAAQRGAPISVWPFYGGTEDSHAIDLFHRFDITWSGTVTHNANGVMGDGSTGLGLTGINPAVALNPASVSMSIYSRTNAANDNYFDMGGSASGISMYIGARSAAGNAGFRIGGGAGGTFSGAVTASTGLFHVHRTSTVTAAATRNGVVAASSSVAVSSLPKVNFIAICAAAGLNFSPRNIAFAHVGPHVTGHLAFYNAVQAYETALGRQV